jgi:hypothetical protein
MKKVYIYKKYVEGCEIYSVVAESREEADAQIVEGMESDDFEMHYSDPIEFAGECDIL